MEYNRGGIIPSGTSILYEPASCPSSYSTPGYSPSVPGSDWIVDGKRFREVHRVSDSIHLRPVGES